MATTPTNLPVPSESPRDLKFNAGKIDEFVTSENHVYVDRFGDEHRTIAGINYDANQAILNYGYITKDSFEDGSTISLANECLRWKSNGEYYRWDGILPKVVPPGSTPDSTGGIGDGKWVSVGDASLRTELSNGKYRSDALAVKYVPGVVIDSTTDNRAAVYAFTGKIYVPKDVQFRCNLLPTDDVTKFIGEGSILTKDQWGNEHVFDVYAANNGHDFTAKMLVNAAALAGNDISIGILGDSITDGVATNGFVPNPVDATTNNLNSSNYDHNSNGGANSWFKWFADILGMAHYGLTNRGKIKAYNAAHQGSAIMTGWPYQNFDYGFFQNAAYGNKAPAVMMFSMGFNDIFQTFTQDQLFAEIDKFIRKCWGYGSAVVFCSTNMTAQRQSELEGTVKKYIQEMYPSVEYIDIAKIVSESYTNIGPGGGVGDSFIQKAGTGWDIVHPTQGTHYQMGGWAAYQFSPGKFIHAKPDTKFLPIDREKVMVEKANGDIGTGTAWLSNPESIPTTSNSDTNGMIAKYVYWPYANAGAAVYIRYLIWCDADQSIDLNTFYVTPSIYPSGTTKTISLLLSHRIRASLLTDAQCIASADASIEPAFNGTGYEHRTTHIARLRRGLNILEVTHSNIATYNAMPMLYFNDAKSLGYSNSDLNGYGGVAPSGGIALLDGQSLPVNNPAWLTFAGRSISDEVPDFYQCGIGEVIQSATFDMVAPLNNFSLVLRYKPAAGTYIILSFIGSAGSYQAQLSIKTTAGLTTQTASISDAIYNYMAAGGRFTVISKSNSTSIIYEDIGAAPQSTTLSYGATGGMMAVRKIASGSALNFRAIKSGCHFIGRNNLTYPNQNQTPV